MCVVCVCVYVCVGVGVGVGVGVVPLVAVLEALGRDQLRVPLRLLLLVEHLDHCFECWCVEGRGVTGVPRP